MIREYLLKFYEKISSYNDFEYLNALLRLNLAPAMSDLKPAVMMNLCNGKRKLKDLWLDSKEAYLDNISLSYIELKESADSILVLFYSPALLEDILISDEIIVFLKEYGYEKCKGTEDFLENLKKRFRTMPSCPDEVGIFLGYPLEDVRDFHCSEIKCKITGYWRCYNNREQAVKKFKRYDRAKISIIESELNKKAV